jgi:Asp-tRNA(Asn)/Glu-tRNA(Gln) amidotransferase A subunit family amidase
MPLGGLRIGYFKNEFERTQGFGPQNTPEQAAARKKLYEDALEALRKAGAHPQATEPPVVQGQPLGIILSAEAAAAFDDITRDKRVDQLSGQDRGDWPNSFRTSRMIPAVEYIRAMRERTLLQQQMDAFMQNWDVIVSPGAGSLLQTTNLTGHPQVGVPCGFLNGNSSISMVFTGRLYDEGTMLRVALGLEQATDWHTMHPKMDFA